ncbi:DUF4233 domain-containing protein [Propionicicella superfundia]|uniref:DUF4233 domain-containing protein n=1 Tax=Propionicicella superfundia TaxID=348582 RepID=UPI0003F915EF|nr:DUF4233 domain-containing protein [Propionicicella superfundia]
MLRRDNPMRAALLSTLVFEVIVFGLAIPAMIQVEAMPWQPAAAIGAAGAVLALGAAALLRTGVAGYVLGWVTQAGIVAVGLVVPMMWFVGGMFAMIWTICFVLGRRLERQDAGV